MVESASSNGLDHLSVDELTAISSRQSHHLRMQRQNVLTKEERLKNLIAQYHRHEQKLDNLKHIRATLQAQESRLRDLKQLKQQVDQQATLNTQLGDELEKSKSVFANREKELAEAVAKVDILTAQLDRSRATPTQRPAPNEGINGTTLTAEIERLKQEQRYRTHVVQQQKRKIDEKDASLLQKTLEKNQLDLRINEIAERLNKRKVHSQSVIVNGGSGGSGSGGSVGSVRGSAAPIAQRPPLAPSGGRDPTKVATVEPYSQRLNYESHETNGGSSKYLESNGLPNPDSTSRYNGQDGQPPKHPLSETGRKEVAPSPPAELNQLNPLNQLNQTNIKALHRSNESSENGEKPRDRSETRDRSENGEKSRDRTTSEKSQQRIELLLRETSNLPNLVTDTLLRDNSDYLRSGGGGTPDTCSSASDSPPNTALVAPPSVTPSTVKVAPSVPSDPTPPKTHRNTTTLPGHHSRLSKETASSSGSQVAPSSGKSGRRVKFHPQALLLDASLEGELELVVKTVQQVLDPSESNDEGITALHNAICAGHFSIVKFLVEYGCDVNAQDTDGWSPLHCAASCNNVTMCRFLIEHGACVFSTTHSDRETAAQKCEEDEADFEDCSRYLLGTLHQLGRANDGIVYAVYDFEAQNADELSFQCGDKMKVLRLSDDDETEWYWAERLPASDAAAAGSGKGASACGYIPRNLLGLYPRVRRTQRAK